MAKWDIKGWIRSKLPGLKAIGRKEIKAFLKELWSQVRKGLAAFLLAILMLILGFDNIKEWFNNITEEPEKTEREVYLKFQVKETYTLTPLDSVQAQVWGAPEAAGITNKEGIGIIKYNAGPEDRTINLSLIKKGYVTEPVRNFAVPEEHGDTSKEVRLLQMKPIETVEKLDSSPPVLN